MKGATRRDDGSYDLMQFPFVEEKIFPDICSIFGGVKKVKFNKLKVRIMLPDYLVVEVRRSELPDPSQWTSFNLADFVRKKGLA